MTHCWTSRYEADGFASTLDWTVTHLSPVELDSWWFTDGGTEADATCLLPKGHAGAHQFTPDSEIIVTFV